jgi:protein transport protein SEC61 subunit gamma-like protein
MALQDIKTFFGKCLRVWHILRKPSMQEFKTVAKVSAVGILIIGLMGFIISILVHIL